MHNLNELTKTEITKKIAEIKVLKWLDDNKNSKEDFIKLSDPFGESGPEVYNPFSNEENCNLRNEFEVEIDYRDKVVRINHISLLDDEIGFEHKKEINKAVLLCIIAKKGGYYER